MDTNYGKNDTLYSVHGIESRKGIWGLSSYKNSNFISNEDNNETYYEGKEIVRLHKSYERDKNLVRNAKENFKEKNNNRIFCEVCGFDFYETYGVLGEDYIEAHHIVPVSKMIEEDVKPSIDNLALVCSNCHKMLHRSIKNIN